MTHKGVAAHYKCSRCSNKFSVEAGSFHNPRCNLCESVYVEWLNFEQYVKQWGPRNLPGAHKRIEAVQQPLLTSDGNITDRKHA
jgi:hypothetical protein